MAKKKIAGYIKLQIKAGEAKPAPPVGPALGSAGLNIMEFCKAFNAETQNMEAGTPIPVVITAYEDRSFTFVTKKPPVSYYLKKAVGVQSGSAVPNKTKIGSITMAQAREIANEKLAEMNAVSIEAATQTVIGSARSMGIEIVE